MAGQSTGLLPVTIHMAGMVKARPPATIDPADMMVCVTLASCRLVLPSAFKKKSEMMAAKMIGQGSAPILSAVYADAAVITAQPMQPMTAPRTVS